jgi:hypothetical protein
MVNRMVLSLPVGDGNLLQHLPLPQGGHGTKGSGNLLFGLFAVLVADIRFPKGVKDNGQGKGHKASEENVLPVVQGRVPPNKKVLSWYSIAQTGGFSNLFPEFEEAAEKSFFRSGAAGLQPGRTKRL